MRQRIRRKVDLIAAAGDGCQCCRIFPAARNAQRRLVSKILGALRGGIEQHRVPTHEREMRCHRSSGAELAGADRIEKIHIDGHVVRAGRNVDVKLVHLARVARPAHSLAVRRDSQSCGLDDRPRRTVFARNPFRVVEIERPRRCRNRQTSMQDVARSIGGIDRDADGVGREQRRRTKEKKRENRKESNQAHRYSPPQKWARSLSN